MISEHYNEDDYVAEEDNYSKTEGVSRYTLRYFDAGDDPTRGVNWNLKSPNSGKAGAEWKRKKKEWKRELLLFGQERL